MIQVSCCYGISVVLAKIRRIDGPDEVAEGIIKKNKYFFKEQLNHELNQFKTFRSNNVASNFHYGLKLLLRLVNINIDFFFEIESSFIRLYWFP